MEGNSSLQITTVETKMQGIQADLQGIGSTLQRSSQNEVPPPDERQITQHLFEIIDRQTVEMTEKVSAIRWLTQASMNFADVAGNQGVIPVRVRKILLEISSRNW